MRRILEKYDMNSFDPDYESMELDEFQPMLLNVLVKHHGGINQKI